LSAADKPFPVDKIIAKSLLRKKAVFVSRTGKKKQIFIAIIAAHGLIDNMHADDLAESTGWASRVMLPRRYVVWRRDFESVAARSMLVSALTRCHGGNRMSRPPIKFPALLFIAVVTVTACVTPSPPPVSHVVDHPPDPSAAARAGDPLPGLTAAQLEMFELSKDEFAEIDTVTGSGGSTLGLGPRFNLNGCAGCHGFPATGGSSGFLFYVKTDPSSRSVSNGLPMPTEISDLIQAGAVPTDGALMAAYMHCSLSREDLMRRVASYRSRRSSRPGISIT
jgi:hypothetical protein